MTVAVLVILALATTYVGTIEAAFSALMRLSLRLTVERNGRAAGLGPYLDDPVLLFVPVRLLLGLIIAITSIIFATLTGVDDVKDPGVLLLSTAGFFIVFEHLLPLLIVRRDPEQVLIRLLPTFKLLERPVRPITLSLVGLIATLRPARHTGAVETEQTAAEDDAAGDAAHAYLEAGEQEGLIEREDRRLIQSIVDFGDTLVREVMTPRPDVVAVSIDATLDELRQVFLEQQYLARARLQGHAGPYPGVRVHQGPDPLDRRQRQRASGGQAAAAGVFRARDQAGVGPPEGVSAAAAAVGRRRRRVRRHGGPGDHRGPARGDRRRDS